MRKVGPWNPGLEDGQGLFVTLHLSDIMQERSNNKVEVYAKGFHDASSYFLENFLASCWSFSIFSDLSVEFLISSLLKRYMYPSEFQEFRLWVLPVE